jgi:hypothetical protein
LDSADKFKTPKFTGEADEAQWWFDHRQELSQAFQDAADKGQLHTGSTARIARERAAAGSTPTTTIRLDPDDIPRDRTPGGQARLAISDLPEKADA